MSDPERPAGADVTSVYYEEPEETSPEERGTVAKALPGRRGRLAALALGAALVGALGILGGARFQNRGDEAPKAAARVADAGAAAGGSPDGSLGAGRSTAGRVAGKDAQTLYLITRSGHLLEVLAARRSVTTSMDALPTGAMVIVQGRADADGAVLATRLVAARLSDVAFSTHHGTGAWRLADAIAQRSQLAPP